MALEGARRPVERFEGWGATYLPGTPEIALCAALARLPGAFPTADLGKATGAKMRPVERRGEGGGTTLPATLGKRVFGHPVILGKGHSGVGPPPCCASQFRSAFTAAQDLTNSQQLLGNEARLSRLGWGPSGIGRVRNLVPPGRVSRRWQPARSQPRAPPAPRVICQLGRGGWWAVVVDRA